jgi:putative membrane protein
MAPKEMSASAPGSLMFTVSNYAEHGRDVPTRRFGNAEPSVLVCTSSSSHADRGRPAMPFIAHILVTAVLLFLVGRLVDGIEVRDGKAAVFGAIMLGLANALVRPLVLFLTLPVTILTLGLFLIVVNALMLMIAAAFVDGFEVEGLSSAVWGSAGLAVMNFLVGGMFG